MCPEEDPWGTGGGGLRKEGCHSNQDDRGCWHATSLQQELLQSSLPLPCFLLRLVEFVKSPQKRCHHQCQSRIDWEGLVGVKRSVSPISCIGCSFFGAPGAFVSCASFSSFSSVSANPSGRVRDRDRRELSSCSCVCCCLWKGVTCVAELLLLIPRILKGGDCILG